MNDMTMLKAMAPKKAIGTPFVIDASGAHHKLEQIDPSQIGVQEKWLQALIHAHPELLPVAQIEPGFGVPVAAAREVVCGHGIIDNLYVTPTGDLVLVEAKLWRNPQARREVVAQALDYVAALMSMDYATFESAILKSGANTKSFYGLVAAHHDALDEAAFFDAVSHNLKRGRMLVIALGDGIRQETEALAGLLQQHMMAQFTFALVELRLYRNPVTGEITTIPSTLTQTVMIERGIIVTRDGMPTVEPMPLSADAKPKSISEDMFYEDIGKKKPGSSLAIRTFLKAVEPLGVYPDLKQSMNLRVDLPDRAKPLSLGYVTKTGKIWTESVLSTAPPEAAMQYLSTLASLIDGQVSSSDYPYVSTNGTSAPTIDQLLPHHAAGWEDAIRVLIEATKAAVPE
jgi:hypothetical protein